MKKKNRKSDVLRKWMLTYLVCMIVPLIFGGLLYQYAIESIEEDVEYVQYQTLWQTREELENALYTCDNIGLALVKSASAEGLCHYEGDNSYSIRQRLYPKELTEDMMLYSSSNEMILDIMIYFPGTDYILKNGRFCPLEYSHETFQSDYQMPLEELRKLAISGNNGLKMLPGQKKLLYSYALYTGKSSQTDRVVLFYLNTTAVCRMMALEDSSVYLLLESGDWISSDGTEYQEEWSFSSQEQENYRRMAGKDAFIMGLSSQEYSLELMNAIPNRTYRSRVRRMQAILFFYLVAGNLVGIGSAWYISRRNYRPVAELLELIGRQGQLEGSGDDFAIIRMAYQKLWMDYRDKDERLKISMAGERSRWMNELLKGGHSSPQSLLAEKRETWLKGMCYHSYMLLGVDILDMGSVVPDQAEEINTEIMDMAYFIIQNVLDELLGEHFVAVEAETDGKLYALINVNDQFDHRKLAGEIKLLGQQLCEFSYHNFNMKLKVDISGIYEGENQVRSCYEDIQEISLYREAYGREEEAVLVWQECIHKMERWQTGFSMAGLEYYIRCGDYDRAENMLHKLRVEREGTKELVGFKKGTKGKEETTADATAMLISEPKPGGIDEPPSIKGDRKDKSKQGEERKGEKRPIEQIVHQVADYIEEHYTDGMLSVGVLADEFDIGLSYLSRSFKKWMGVGLLDYINRLRLERAKELIGQGLAIKDVAEQVGYYNAQPLVRVFRQMEGMTPSEYRELSQEK